MALKEKFSLAAHGGGAAISRRIIQYVIGVFLIALGVSFSVKSNLGVLPVSALPYVLSRIFEMDMGLVTALLFTLYVLIQFLMLRREFQVKNFMQILVGMLFGSFVSITNALMSFEMPNFYLLRLVFIAIGIFLVALGLTLLLAANIMPQPPEGVMLAIQHRTGWKLPNIKIGFDCTVVGLAFLAGLLHFGELTGVREGTVLAAVLVGAVMGLLKKFLPARFIRYINGE